MIVTSIKFGDIASLVPLQNFGGSRLRSTLSIINGEPSFEVKMCGGIPED